MASLVANSCSKLHQGVGSGALGGLTGHLHFRWYHDDLADYRRLWLARIGQTRSFNVYDIREIHTSTMTPCSVSNLQLVEYVKSAGPGTLETFELVLVGGL